MKQDLLISILYMTDKYHILSHEQDLIDLFSCPNFEYWDLLCYFILYFDTERADFLYNVFYDGTISYVDK